jgi:hypothetical protein
MDKTIKINLAGVLFQIEEDAYHMLRDYLQAVNLRFRNAPGGDETIEDIELRIAEIFQSQQSLAGVISKENVEGMIVIIGRPEDFDHSENQVGSSAANNAPLYETRYDRKSPVGNAINEVFKAIWRVCYIIIRIILTIAGVALVLTGFLSILCFIMVFVFKYPGIYSSDVFDLHLIYFPDFLGYIVNPAVVPWIIALTLIAIILPMLALIYWGVKMIFWFKAKAGVFSLIGFVLWILTLTALAIILFNEGISFTETARFSTLKAFSHPCDTLYIKTCNKITGLKYDKELSLDNERYTVFISDEKKEIYIRPYLNIKNVNDEVAKVEVRRRSSGRSEIVAAKKAEELIYDYHINGDTLFLDEYFTIPSGHKWAADNIGIYLTVRKGTILKFDSDSENLLNRSSIYESDEGHKANRWRSGRGLWIISDEGIRDIDEHSAEKR